MLHTYIANTLLTVKPVGAAISLIDSKQVPLSVSICKLIGILDHSADINPVDVPIELIDHIIVSGPYMSLDLFNNGTYDTMVLLDKVFLCKEFLIPVDVKVNKIQIIHRFALNEYGQEEKGNGKQMKIYVHMQGSFLLNQFVEQIDKEILTQNNSPFTEIFMKMENFDLSQGVECMNGDWAYDECIFKDALQFLNRTVGCALTLRR